MYIYTYANHEDEASLRELELHSLFGQSVQNGVIMSTIDMSVDRSPFVKRRIEVYFESDRLEVITEQLPTIELEGRSFKVLFTMGDEAFTFEEQRQLERLVGAEIRGKADMRTPELRFGLTKWDGRWYFGPCEDNQALWLKHQNKPQNYSTALPTRAARAIVNLAAGSNAAHTRIIDPCCGMGTVLIEAMSMGIDIEGVDINPLAVRGARTNLAHFGYPNRVKLADMQELDGYYDAAIIDMPYNLCSVLPEEEQLAMLRSVRRLAKRTVVITTERVEKQLEMAAFRLIEYAALSKASFTRYISVVE